MAIFERFVKRRSFRIYIETSALNYLIEHISPEAVEGSRLYHVRKNKELIVSPVGLWEIFVSQDDNALDYLVWCSQQMFSRRLFASPSEVVVRFLNQAYPHNVVNYNVFCELEIAKIWDRMSDNRSIKFEYDKEAIVTKTDYVRQLSKKLPSIIRYPNIDTNTFSEEEISLAKVINTYYEFLLSEESYPAKLNNQLDDFDYFTLNKLIIFFMILLMILKMDMDAKIIDDFWSQKKIADQDLTKKLMFFFESYPRIFEYGPFMQMALTAYFQIKSGKSSRGLILDCYHSLYVSYSDIMLTADSGLRLLKDLDYFDNRLMHISDVQIFETTYKK